MPAPRDTPVQKSGAIRRQKTDAEKATEAVELQERKIQRANIRIKDAKAALKEAEEEVKPLEARMAYLLQDPALPKEEREKRQPKPVIGRAEG